uniref:Predicted protein n=1 Tax=Hordeum vulgare subsp. vulgare TaxID=112509 RepID=F2D3X2_HORVV|nr:predicted protein [Hordeum vulgare subsp. vulgare]
MMDLQYLWALGHLVTLTSAARILYAYTIGIFSKTIPGFWYHAAYAGALVSYSIVVSKSLGVPQFNRAYLQKAMMEDNAQYGFMAVYWFLSKPVYFSLLPFATFSFFHVLTFFRGTILPKMFTAPTPATRPAAGSKPVQHPVVEKYGTLIGNFIKQNYDRAMFFVAYSEVGILLWTILRAVTLRGSFTTPLIVSQWLRVRYLSSNFERKVIDNLVIRLDHMAAQQSPAINNVYKQAKSVISMWGSAVSTPNASANRSTASATGVNAGTPNAAGMRERTAAAGRR